MKAMLWSTLILALSALPLAAQTPQGRGLRSERMAQTLNLSEAQKSSIKAIREKHRPDLLVRRDNARQAQIALRTALSEPKTPEVQLRILHDKAAAARFEMRLTRRAIHQEVLAVLTPEQRVKATEMHVRAQARMHNRMKHLRMAAGMAS
jgi:Spy/CpxP family protein refolding chaperone